MKFTLELLIDKPQAEVWKAFDNPKNLPRWQPTLLSSEPVSGTPGQPGAITKLTYRENEREFSLIEKIAAREEPDRLDSLYDNNFAENTVRNTFIAKGSGQTLWVVETIYKFKTLAMKVMGPLLKKNLVARTQRDMERFKTFVEA